MEVATRNGWQLYAFTYFLNTLKELTAEAKRQQQANPTGFYTHSSVKMLASISQAIQDDVPENPGNKKFLQGNTLGKKNRHWYRIKSGLPNRYRLFFRYQSNAPKSIIYAWINDNSTLRKAGAKTDVYEVFKEMLKQEKIPNTWEDLLKQSDSIPKLS